MMEFISSKSSSSPCFLMIFLVLTMSSSSSCVVGQGMMGSPPCGSTFFSALIQLMPCRPAVIPYSPFSPSEACCNAVRALGQPCLCALLSGPPLSGIDKSMAMQIPGKCSTNFEPCGTQK